MAHKPWQQYYEPGAKAWQPRYSDALSAFRAAARSGRGGISYFGRRWSFADIDAASDRLCAWAHAQGVAPGARISIILQNVPAFPIVLVAAWKLGAIPVPGNSAYRALELGRLFADYRPSLVVCHPEHEPEVRQALDAVSVTAPILVVSSVEHGEHPDSRVVPANDAVARHHRRLSEILDAESPSAAPPARTRCEPSDLGLLLYTSGTSGEPKGTMLRHSSLINNAEMMADWGGLHGDSRILGAAPSFHITGVVCQVLISIVRQCWLILHYRFEPSVVLDVIRRERPTYAVAAITAFNALASAPGVSAADFTSFEQIYTGGAPVPPALQRSLKERLGVEIRNCYGMTETSSATHYTPRNLSGPVDSASGALSIGIPQSNSDAKIVDDDGQEVAPGEIGELWLWGPGIMQGYWNKPVDTAAALTDGWMHSGDVGFMDRNGWFYLIDRKKDMINASGFKVWPREVEDTLYRHPDVREAAVVGEPDTYRGETVIAYVSLREGATVDAAALIAHCRTQLAGYKCPREVRVLPDLPKTLTGKILRRALRSSVS